MPHGILLSRLDRVYLQEKLKQRKYYAAEYMTLFSDFMGLLSDKWIAGCASTGNAGNVFPDTAGQRSRHASRHVHDARVVIANWQFILKALAGKNVPDIHGAYATRNFAYLVKGHWSIHISVSALKCCKHKSYCFQAVLLWVALDLKCCQSSLLWRYNDISHYCFKVCPNNTISHRLQVGNRRIMRII